MIDIRAGLRDRIEQMKIERTEIQRNIELLDARISEYERVLGAEDLRFESEQIAKIRQNGSSPLHSLDLRAAVERLKDDNPEWDHTQIKDHLLQIHFDFGGGSPGRKVYLTYHNLMKRRTGAQTSD